MMFIIIIINQHFHGALSSKSTASYKITGRNEVRQKYNKPINMYTNTSTWKHALVDVRRSIDLIQTFVNDKHDVCVFVFSFFRFF